MQQTVFKQNQVAAKIVRLTAATAATTIIITNAGIPMAVAIEREDEGQGIGRVNENKASLLNSVKINVDVKRKK